MLKPSTPPAAFFWSTANLTPLEVDWPPVVQTGKSEPILIVPLLPPPPPPVVPPQAKATIVATVRTTSPLARTIWFPLVLVGRQSANHTERLPSLAALFPTRVGARVRRRRVRPHGMAELLLRGKLSTSKALQVKSDLRRGPINKVSGRCSRPPRPASRRPARRGRAPRRSRSPCSWCRRRRRSPGCLWPRPGRRSRQARKPPGAVRANRRQRPWTPARGRGT